MTFNFREICRLCLGKKESLAPLFREQVPDTVTSLPAKIMSFVPVLKLCADDGLPSQVCLRCSQLVNLSYEFKLQCESSDATLRQYLKSHIQNCEDGIIHSVFRSDNGGSWDYAVERDEETEDSFDDEFDHQSKSYRESSLKHVSSVHGHVDNETKNNEPDSLVETEVTSAEETREIEYVHHKSDKKNSENQNFALERVRKKYKDVIASKKSDINNVEVVKLDACDRNGKPLVKTDSLDSGIKSEEVMMKRSKARIRGEKKGFLCQDCGKIFSYEQHLLLHRRTHTGEKPFSCSACGECFSVSSNLNKHMRIHTGEKPFLCTVCGRSFSRSDTLTKHMRSHTGEKPFHCSVCGNNFGRRSILTNHMRTHSGEKPYLCTECGQRFAQSYDLTKHMRSHSGERPYHCTMCRMCFGQRNSLTKHMKCHPAMPFHCLDFSKGFSYRIETDLLPHSESVKLWTQAYRY